MHVHSPAWYLQPAVHVELDWFDRQLGCRSDGYPAGKQPGSLSSRTYASLTQQQGTQQAAAAHTRGGTSLFIPAGDKDQHNGWSSQAA